MIRKIKKTNFILSLLVIAFFIVSLSLILEMQIPSKIIPDQPTIIEIEEHIDVQISHGGDQWPLGCAECHFEPVYGECEDCHIPDFWVGEDDSIYHAHHDPAYTGFSDCWDVNCHNADPEDVRYVKGDLVVDDDWHGYCDDCHEIYLHGQPEN